MRAVLRLSRNLAPKMSSSALQRPFSRSLHTSMFLRDDVLPEQPYQSHGSSEELRGNFGNPETASTTQGELDPVVVGLIDQLSTLNLVQVNQLVTELKDRFGFVEAAPVAVAAAAVPAAGAAAAEEVEEVAEKKIFNIKLESFEATAKIKVIKEVRAATGLGLKESKEMVEGAPGVIAKDIPKDEAEAIIAKIEAAGGKAVME